MKKSNVKERPIVNKLERMKSRDVVTAVRFRGLRPARGCFPAGLPVMEMGRRDCAHPPPRRREEKGMQLKEGWQSEIRRNIRKPRA